MNFLSVNDIAELEIKNGLFQNVIKIVKYIYTYKYYI